MALPVHRQWPQVCREAWEDCEGGGSTGSVAGVAGSVTHSDSCSLTVYTTMVYTTVSGNSKSHLASLVCNASKISRRTESSGPGKQRKKNEGTRCWLS